MLTLRDLRLALRSLLRRPGFLAAVVATLAIGIGAATTVFAVVDAALLRPLPFREPGRLVVVSGVAGPERDVRGASVPEVADWARRSRTLADVAAVDELALGLRTADGAERVAGEIVSASYFRVLGARAARGRTFTPAEDAAPDAAPVVVVSDALWRSRLGGDPSLVGRTITLNDRPLTVVGIMPPGFRGASFEADVWVPTAMLSLVRAPSAWSNRGSRWLSAVGRLRDGRTPADARRDLDAVARQLAADFPATNHDRWADVQPLRERYVAGTRAMLLGVLSAVLLFVLIACANVMGLQLVRATGRRQELGLRLAIGASRWHVARQLLAEGVVLAAAGWAVGLLLASWGVAALVALAPDGVLPAYARPALDGRVLGFSGALVAACAVACGLAPLLARRDSLADGLRHGARAVAAPLGGVRRLGVQQLLVVAQIAVSFTLLVGGGLMLRTLARQLAVRTGFAADGVLVARVTLPRGRYAPEARAGAAERLAARLAALPGVRAASVSSDLPFLGGTSAATLDVGDARDVRYYRHAVSPAFFETLGIALRAGRAFTAADREDTPPVVIVTEAMARRHWPGADPVGQRVRLGGGEATVVGVVAAARFRELTLDPAAPGSEPDVFVPLAQRPASELTLAVRARGVPPSAASLRAAIGAVDPALAVFDVGPLARLVARQHGAARFGTLVLGALSGAALLLAAIGVYGIIAFVVALARREIAVRVALGADARALIRHIVRNGMTLVLLGAGAGLIGAAALARVLRDQLYGVRAGDPLTYGAVLVAVVAAGLAASWLPARRAAHVDPQLALRGD